MVDGKVRIKLWTVSLDSSDIVCIAFSRPVPSLLKLYKPKPVTATATRITVISVNIPDRIDFSDPTLIMF